VVLVVLVVVLWKEDENVNEESKKGRFMRCGARAKKTYVQDGGRICGERSCRGRMSVRCRCDGRV